MKLFRQFGIQIVRSVELDPWPGGDLNTETNEIKNHPGPRNSKPHDFRKLHTKSYSVSKKKNIVVVSMSREFLDQLNTARAFVCRETNT